MADLDKIGDYELVNCIATGSATQIWEVKKAGSPQPLAMKLLLEEAFKDPEAKKVLKHEATIGKVMEHPNIIRIHEVKFTKQHGYLIMEYFRAGNLKQLIRSDRGLAQARAKRMMESMAQALAFFHEKGWVHRDVKPDNILLNKGGEVRLIDFSLSSKPSNAILRAVTKKTSIVIQGTRTYLAPELIRREALTFSADMYSLGVTLFETLTGNPPFRTANPNDLLMMHVRDAPPNPADLDDNITPEAGNLVLKMLSKKPKDRPGSMQELFAEVRGMKFFKEDPVQVHRARREAYELSDAQASEDRLNSRRDAERDRSLDAEKPKPKPKPKPIVEIEKPVAPQPVAPAAPQAPPGGMPGYGWPPGMPMPGYPGMPLPGQLPGQVAGQMPHMPMGMPPGYPGMMPGFPGMLPGQMPPGYPQQMGMPGAVPYPPGYPPTAMPSPVPGVPQQPVVAQPSVPKAAPTATPPSQQAEQRTKSPDDLPLATLDDLEIE